jgi:protein-disulfide isomerase
MLMRPASLRFAAFPVLLLLTAIVLPERTALAQDKATTDEPALSPTSSVAVIGKNPVSYADLLAAADAPLLEQKFEYDTQLHQLETNYARARHDLLQSELGKLVDQRVLQLEAQARKTEPSSLLSHVMTPAVTDAEARAYYEEHKAQTNESFEALAGKIKDHLLQQKKGQATEQFYAGLRAKYAAVLTLEPLRATVAADGPSRGPSTAPVTIVEFADFQCPYCRSLEPVLTQVLKRSPDSVRLVYRHLPLTELHPEAMHAAEAAICAQKQNKFWEMHDAIYASTDTLTVGQLRGIAQRIGLDSQQFEECVHGTLADVVIQRDMKAARELAIQGTPALFVNGRFVGGAVPLANLTALIDDELRRKNQRLASAREPGTGH